MTTKRHKKQNYLKDRATTKRPHDYKETQKLPEKRQNDHNETQNSYNNTQNLYKETQGDHYTKKTTVKHKIP